MFRPFQAFRPAWLIRFPYHAALGAAALTVVLGGCSDSSEEREPGELTLQEARAGRVAHRVETIGGGDVQAISTPEIAEADEAYWKEESISNELIAEPLKALKVIVYGPWGAVSSRPPLSYTFTDDARLPALEPVAFEEQPVTIGVVAKQWGKDQPDVGLDEWKAKLDEFHAGSNRVRIAVFKPAQVALTDYGAEALLKVKVNRELPSGGIEHLQCKWRTEWVKTDQGKWRCRRAEVAKGAETLISEAPHFVDATLEALRGTGIDPRLPTPMEGVNRSVTLADLDGDGDLDLVTTQPVRLLYNRGNGTFEDKTESKMLGGDSMWDEDSDFSGCLAQDFDRDGFVDLLFAITHDHVLLFLQKDDQFWPKALPDTDPNGIPLSLSAADVDEDGWLDVFVANYGPFIHPGPNIPTAATNGRANQMMRGLPEGEFEDVTEAWGFDEYRTRWTFIGAFGDADDDGDLDLYAANDFGPNVLYRRQSGEKVQFRAEMEDATKVDAGFSMSATFADLDGDLDLDLYVSNMSSTAANRVRAMPGDPREKRLGIDVNDVRRRMSKGNTILFQDEGLLAEASADYGAKSGSWAWGAAVFDYDCDGDLDIHCVNGMWSQGADDGRDL